MTYTSYAPRKRTKFRLALGLAGATAMVAFPGMAAAASGGIGVGGDPSGETTVGTRAKIENGYAVPPADASPKVVRAIEAANRIVKNKPYCMGGGHQTWNDSCYDCSGTVSYALGDKGARILDAPMPSGSFMRWEKRGLGRWITVYANEGHMYAVIAGLRLDTANTAGDGPGWSRTMLRQRGFAVRHPQGL